MGYLYGTFEESNKVTLAVIITYGLCDIYACIPSQCMNLS
jgi:hypothetical protein